MVEFETLVMQILTGAGSLIAVAIVITICGIAFWLYNKNVKKYSMFRCIIWRKDGFGQLTQKYDNAGIFVDKDTKNKRLFLKKANVGLNPDNIPYIPTGNKKVIYLLQSGLKNFTYIKPEISDDHIKLTVGEEDVNWSINAYEKQKKLFAQSWIMQYLPFIILAFVCMIILILFMYLFKQFDTIKELIMQMQELAKIMVAARSGTVVI